MIKKVCLITPSHISSNPRLVKESKALIAFGYKVHIVFAQTLDYLKSEDEKLLRDNPEITFDIIPNKNIFNSLIHKICFQFSRLINRVTFCNYLINKNYRQFFSATLKNNADLYVAHNLGALPIAISVAKQNNSKCGFDAEDFHRNELTDDVNHFDVILKSHIEDKFFDKTDYLTSASPLISKSYKTLYPHLNLVTINNVFQVEHQPQINLNYNDGLKLFWFSQTIGKDRGLEDVIEALNILRNPLIELHLLGNLSQDNYLYFSEFAHFDIQYHLPISGDEIFNMAATFDVGLALELGEPLNRDICLTNKIFTYLISGLAIIASDTQAQELFIKENHDIGKLYKSGDTRGLAATINKFLNDKNLLNNCKKNAYQLARSKYNWEMEQKKYLEIIKNL